MSQTYGGGWTCSLCGAWVPAGTTHSCQWNTGTGQAYKADPTWMLLNAINAVQSELKRIADALQALNYHLKERDK